MAHFLARNFVIFFTSSIRTAFSRAVFRNHSKPESRASKKKMEARAGIEPAMELLQSSALPLGDPALGSGEPKQAPRASQ